MKLTYAELSWTGPVRANNEDCVGFRHSEDSDEQRMRGSVALLADGVGGQSHGELASRIAVTVGLNKLVEAKRDTAPNQLLWSMFTAANLAVYDAGMQNREQGRMATTLTVSLFRHNQVAIGHVGDCRAYVIQGGRIRRITSDHSYTALQVKLGLLSEEEARASELRTVLTRSLGKDPTVQVDYYSVTVNRGDRLVQCSDGLHGFITEQEILETVSRLPPSQACAALVELAGKRGTDDNVSIQIVQIDQVEQVLYYRGLPVYHEVPEVSKSGDVKIGDVLDDRFFITDVISRSGMASIFKATDLKTSRPVALKVPFMQFESDPGFFSRFEREEQIGKVLDHPYILHIVPTEGEKSRPYIVTEYLEVETLRQVLHTVRPMPVSDALRVASRLCEALDYMHRHDVVHRDLKPENVMICNDGTLRIMDFGIAKVAGFRRLTFTGFSPAMGTPDYMAPEQVKGQRGDQRTDIYSLGAMLYEMLTGSAPFEGTNPYMIMNARLTGDPVAPRKLNPALPPEVEEIVLHAMERSPADRYPSAAAMKAELDAPETVELTGRHERLKPPQMWRTRWRVVRTIVLAILVPILVFGLLYLAFR